MNKQNWISFNEIPRKERYRNVRLVNKGTMIALAGTVVFRFPYLMAGGQIFAANCLYGLGLVLIFRYTYSFMFGMLFPFFGKSFACPWARLAGQILIGPILWATGMTWFYGENFAWGFRMFEIAFVLTCLAYLAGALCGYRKAARRRERKEETDEMILGRLQYLEEEGKKEDEGKPQTKIVLGVSPRKR